MADEASDSPRASFGSFFDVSVAEPASEDASVEATQSEETQESDDKPEGDESESLDSSQEQQDNVVEGEEKQTGEEPEKTSEETQKTEGDKEEKSSQETTWEAEKANYEKRLKDTQSSWQQQHQENLQLKQSLSQLAQEVSTLRKIADGTYDPEKDAPPAQNPEDLANQGVQIGKVVTSHAAAVRQMGEEKLNEELTKFGSRFGENRLVNALVLQSEDPIAAALEYNERFEFQEKYGLGPKAQYEAIKAEVLKAEEPEMRKRLTEEILGRAKKKDTTPTGLSSSRGSNGLESGKNSRSSGPTPLKNIFG